jgi:putative peptidoglycan lipid II flippase
MQFALASVAANIALGLLLFRMVGFPGIAAATAAASWLNVALMLLTLVRRSHYRPSRATLARILKLLAASLALGAALALASWGRPYYEHAVFRRKEISLLAVSAGGFLLYALSLLALRAVTIGEIRAALRRRPGSVAAGTDLP